MAHPEWHAEISSTGRPMSAPMAAAEQSTGAPGPATVVVVAGATVVVVVAGAGCVVSLVACSPPGPIPSAASVRGPAMPSTSRPLRAWKSRTAAWVRGPYVPSAAIG